MSDSNRKDQNNRLNHNNSLLKTENPNNDSNNEGIGFLKTEQKRRILESFSDDEEVRHLAQKKIIDDAEQTLYEIIFILECADEFPDVRSKIPPELIQSLNDAYFMAFKVDTKFSDPKEVMSILAANCVLHRKCADLRQKICELIHRVEYYKYMTKHMDGLLNELRKT